jgi:hypothetical protein
MLSQNFTTHFTVFIFNHTDQSDVGGASMGVELYLRLNEIDCRLDTSSSFCHISASQIQLLIDPLSNELMIDENCLKSGFWAAPLGPEIC